MFVSEDIFEISLVLFFKTFCPCVFVSRRVNYQRIRRRSWRGKPNGSSVCWTRGCWTCRGWRSWMEFCRRMLLETHERSGGSVRTERMTTNTHKVRYILYIYIQLAQEENLIKLNHSFESCFNDSFELICKKCWFTWMKEGFVSWGTEIYYYFKNEALWNTLWGILWAIERLCTI